MVRSPEYCVKSHDRVRDQNDSIVMHKVKKLASRALIVVEFVSSASIIHVLISGGDAE